MGAIVTERLVLEPITLPLVEAVFAGNRELLEELSRAKIPAAWPGKSLVERAFSASLEAIRADPPKRLWGDRLMLLKERDDRDTTRADSPLRPADDACIVDSTGLTIDEVFQKMMTVVEERERKTS